MISSCTCLNGTLLADYRYGMNLRIGIMSTVWFWIARHSRIWQKYCSWPGVIKLTNFSKSLYFATVCSVFILYDRTIYLPFWCWKTLYLIFHHRFTKISKTAMYIAVTQLHTTTLKQWQNILTVKFKNKKQHKMGNQTI